MPWPMVASLLSMVAILGAEMVFTTPVFSRAERRRLRLKAPPAEPKVKPMPPPDPCADGGREVDGVVRRRRRCPWSGLPPAAPARARRCWGRRGRSGCRWRGRSCALPPHWTPIGLGEVGGGLDDAALDEDLRRLGVEVAHQALGPGQRLLDVLHDEDVGALVDGDGAALGEHVLDLRPDMSPARGEVDRDEADLERDERRRAPWRPRPGPAAPWRSRRAGRRG